MRKTRRGNPLTTSEQALYYELIAICNDDGWKNVFNCSNDELMRALNISENTLNASRNTLIKVGLISYRSGKSRREFGTYSLRTVAGSPSASTSNFDTEFEQTPPASPSEMVAGSPSASTSNFEDYNKQNKTKTKHTSSNEEVPKKKSASKKKNFKATGDKTPYWQKMIETWIIFYKKNYILEPTFNGTQCKALKNIIARLKKLSEDQKFPWTEEYAIRVFNHFLLKAHSDKFLKTNFLLHILYSHFDSIIQKDERNSKTHSGSNSSTISAIAKIDTMSEYDAKPGA